MLFCGAVDLSEREKPWQKQQVIAIEGESDRVILRKKERHDDAQVRPRNVVRGVCWRETSIHP